MKEIEISIRLVQGGFILTIHNANFSNEKTEIFTSASKLLRTLKTHLDEHLNEIKEDS